MKWMKKDEVLKNCNGGGRYHFACIIPKSTEDNTWFNPFIAVYTGGMLIPWMDDEGIAYESVLEDVTHMIPIDMMTSEEIDEVVLSKRYGCFSLILPPFEAC